MSETEPTKEVVEEHEGEGEEEEDEELTAMKKKFKEMQEEAEKIEQMHKQADQVSTKPVDGKDVDKRSVYVGNVDYSSTPKELQDHFQSCGTINRITILCDKFTGHPKGFAYVEFADEESITNAMVLNESLFKGRPLKVTPKRTNIPGLVPRGYYPPPFQRGGGFRRSGGRFPRARSRRAYYHPYQ